MTAPKYDIWDYYDLVISLEDIAGGIPQDPRLIDAWQRAHWNKNAKLLEGDPQSPEEAAERTRSELGPVVEDEAGWTTFKKDDAGRICTEGRVVKAMLKECANIMKGLIPVTNAKGVDAPIPLRARLAEHVFVVERLIPLYPERKAADDMLEKPIHPMTAQGPRDALKRTDVCYKPVEVRCTLQVLRGKPMIFTFDVLDQILYYAQMNGLGADRSQGFGQFTYKLTKRK